ncbi:hypothetical protein JXM67_15115 [candidate division WOR-3 bacterium]|nr:hypothetical protein [candidate division WOR-3 bacterium]
MIRYQNARLTIQMVSLILAAALAAYLAGYSVLVIMSVSLLFIILSRKALHKEKTLSLSALLFMLPMAILMVVILATSDYWSVFVKFPQRVYPYPYWINKYKYYIYLIRTALESFLFAPTPL